MREVETSKMLTPEMIETVADNWDKLRGLFDFEEERRHCKCDHNKKHKECEECCCPEFLKFNFWFSDVKIINKNAECEDEDKHDRRKDDHKHHRCEDDHKHDRCKDDHKHHKCKHHRYRDEY